MRVNEIKSHPGGLNEDDPALQTYRSLHLVLHAPELSNNIPDDIVESIRTLVRAGESRNYHQLSIASLDLFESLLEKRLATYEGVRSSENLESSTFWRKCWRKSIEGIAAAAESSSDSVRKIHPTYFDYCLCGFRFTHRP
jgi:hypothetical protein